MDNKGIVIERDTLQPQEEKRKSSRILLLALVLIGVYFFSIWFVIDYDVQSFSAAYVSRYITQNVSDFFNWIMGNGVHDVITMKVRQYLIITLTGCSLAAVGAMFKSIFRNELAAPTTLGVQEGGILGSLLFVAIFGAAVAEDTALVAGNKVKDLVDTFSLIQRCGCTIFIFAGCFIGAFIVIMISTSFGRKTMSSAALVLTGTVVNGAIAGIASAFQYELTVVMGDDDTLMMMLNMTMGTFEYSFYSTQFRVMCATLLPCMIFMLFWTNHMNLYSLGDEEAKGMGMNVRAYRLMVMLLGVFMTAITMVYCGHIAYIGFIVPQVAQKVVGTDFRKLYPASILLGGTVMLLVYDLAKFTGMRDGLSLFTTFIGGIMLIYMLFHRKEGKDAAVKA